MHKNNFGFSLPILLIALALVALLGFVGWRIWNSDQKGKQSTDTQQSQQQTNQQQPTGETPENKSTYLEIKELGVKIELNEAIKDAVYYYDYSSSQPIVRISTQSLIDASNGSCDPKASSPFGSLRKTREVNQPDGSTLRANGVNVFQFGQDYIVYSNPTQACTVDQNVSNLQTSQLQALKEALKTMQLSM